jgi:hypothetical protein
VSRDVVKAWYNEVHEIEIDLTQAERIDTASGDSQFADQLWFFEARGEFDEFSKGCACHL